MENVAPRANFRPVESGLYSRGPRKNENFMYLLTSSVMVTDATHSIKTIFNLVKGYSNQNTVEQRANRIEQLHYRCSIFNVGRETKGFILQI